MYVCRNSFHGIHFAFKNICYIRVALYQYFKAISTVQSLLKKSAKIVDISDRFTIVSKINVSKYTRKILVLLV